MGPNKSDGVSESSSSTVESENLMRLQKEVEGIPLSCNVRKRDNGMLEVELETYVIVLQGGKIDSTSQVRRIKESLTIDENEVGFQYSKFVQDGWNIQETKVPRGQKEHRSTLPILKVVAPPGTTLLRLGHLYRNSDGTLGATSGIFGLLPDYKDHENASRYFPDDSTEGLNDVNIKTVILSSVDRITDPCLSIVNILGS